MQGESPFTLKLDPFSQDTAVERDVSPSGVFCRSLSGRTLLPRSWRASWGSSQRGVFVWLSWRNEKLLTKRLPALGTAVRMKTNLERSLSIKKSLLLLYRGSVNGGKTGSQIYISFQKVNTWM